MGPKSEDVEKPLVKARNKTPPPLPPTLAGGAGLVEKVRFFIKNDLCRHLELCFLCRRGAHFQKIMKKCWQNVKNAVKIMSDTSKCHQHSVAYMKMSSK